MERNGPYDLQTLALALDPLYSEGALLCAASSLSRGPLLLKGGPRICSL